MTITSASSLREVAFMVCTALARDGLTAVLSGGGAATIWAPVAIQSDDLDFILIYRTKEQPKGMSELDYRLENGMYTHPENRYSIEFPPGPLAVGRDILTNWETQKEKGLLLHVISPTDSCRDRLAAYLHWDDYGALNQALAVAKNQAEWVDLDLIQEWCRSEGKPEKYEEFARLLGSV